MITKNTSEIMSLIMKLSGHIEINSITFSQKLLNEKYRESGANDLVFINKMYGVYFYTSRSEMEKMCHLQIQKLPVYVGIDGTLSIYEIK